MGEMLLSMGRGGGEGLSAQIASVPGLQMLLFTQVALGAALPCLQPAACLPACLPGALCLPTCGAAATRCQVLAAEPARACSALPQLRVLQQMSRECMIAAFHQEPLIDELRLQHQRRQQQRQQRQQRQQQQQQQQQEQEQQQEQQQEQLPEHARGLGFSALVLLQAGYTGQLKLGELA
jgi:hypothetical protein